MDYQRHFTLTQDAIYLNCAAQGPLTNVGAEAVALTVRDKQFPSGLDLVYGEGKTSAARRAISRLIDFPEENISLANSTSWGMNVIAQGLPLNAGDEVLMFEGQFPSNVAPWEAVKSKGIVLKKIKMDNFIFDMERFKNNLSPKTKAVSLEWVHFVSGDRIPLKEISQVCGERGIFVIVDVTQGVGAIPFSMRELKPDAIACSAYKWLLSPYGSGFLAMSDKLISLIEPKMINWLSFPDIKHGRLAHCDYTLCSSAQKFDVFSHMGYFNVSGMAKSVELINELGVKNTYQHTRDIIDYLNEKLNPELYERVNSGAPERQSLIATFKVKKAGGEQTVQQLHGEKIFISLREGYLRISPFIYNTKEEIDLLAKKLNH